MARLTNTLLKQAQAAARKHHELSGKITNAFIERYGVTHSDVDCDNLIDSLDYGHTNYPPTVTACDIAMAACGAFPKEPRP